MLQLSVGDVALRALFFVVLGAAGLACGNYGASAGVGLTVATAMILATPIVARLARGRHLDVFEPLVLFVVAYGVMFVVRPAYMLAVGTDFYQISGTAIDISGTFTRMQVLGLLGALGFVLGYESRLGSRLAGRFRPVANPSSSALAGAATVIAVLGAVSVFLFVVSIGGPQVLFAGRGEAYYEALNGASKYVYYAPTCLVGAAVLYLGAWWSDRRALYLLGFVTCACLLLVARGPIGSRLALFPLFAAPALFLFVVSGKRPRAISITVTAILAVVASSLILETRDQTAREEGGVRRAAVELLASPLQAFVPLTEGQDAAIAPALASALTVVPSEIGHTYGGATVGDLVSRGIPRALWESKPRSPREQVVEKLFSEQSYANPEFSAIFAWYTDWGWPGALLGLALYGILGRALIGYLQRNKPSVLAATVFAVSWPMLGASFRDVPVDSFVRAVFVVGPIGVTAFLFGRAERSLSAAESENRVTNVTLGRACTRI